MIYHLVGHEILNKQCILFIISTYISRENVCKIAKNGNFKMQIYEANDISSCRAYNSEQNAVFF